MEEHATPTTLLCLTRETTHARAPSAIICAGRAFDEGSDASDFNIWPRFLRDGGTITRQSTSRSFTHIAAMPKATTSSARQERRHNPLSDEYAPTAPLKQKAGKKRKSAHAGEHQEAYIDSKASRRILDLGQDLAAEDEAERRANQQSAEHAQPNPAFAFESRFPHDVVSDEEEGGEEGAECDDEEAWASEAEVEEIEVDPQDLDMFNKFNPSFDPATLLEPEVGEEAQGPGTNLADLILQKIAAHQAQIQGAPGPQIQGGGDPDDAVELPAKVVEVYTQVGLLLSRYKSGKLPKPFKILPTLPQWDTLLSITRPGSWTPNAVYEATKLFTSSRPALAQAFCSDILLPRVREDIMETKKLNVHLYKALKKSLYKPAAFFRGLVFPLVASGTCTLREATIVSSVVARVSIPVLHSATALYRLCEIAAEQMLHDVESAGACNIFIRTLLEKKYALPYRVVDALVFHFLRFRAIQPQDGDVNMDGTASAVGGKNGSQSASAKLPVLWHQCLLAFAQRYKNEITEDQREALLDLLLVRGHKEIGPEVRRELLEGRGRGVPAEGQADGNGGVVGGDDTMMMG
jgi:essential nuclear protein 1